MKHEQHEPRTCPRCGATYCAHGAISRADNQTLICPDCGVREALEAIGCGPAEQESILETIHKYSGGRHD